MLKIIPLTLFLMLILMTNSMQSDEEQKAREFYRRAKETAHPPIDKSELEIIRIPMLQSEQKKLFLNVAASVDQGGVDITQNESSIAVNPKNPLNLIASAVDYRDNSATWVYVSSDGGRTWVNKNLGRAFPGWRCSNDPSVAFDADGVGYLVYGGFGEVSSDTTVLFGENGVFIARSFDEGKTWEAHIPIILHRGKQTLDSTFEDKYYISVDLSPKSPYFNHLYVPWKRVTPRDSATQIVISKSTDKGKTWSVPVAVSHRLPGSSEDTTYGQSFPLATTGPNGELYVVWNHGIEHGVGFAKSTDGGKTFSEPRIIQRYNIFGETRLLPGQGWRHSVKGRVRAETYPSIVCDITGSERNGYLYLTWAGDRIPNIYFSYSSNQGESWSEPKIIHSDTTNDQFWQWISIDPSNGDLAVMYLDSRNDPANIMIETYVSYSSDGGKTWVDRRVSDISHDLRLNPFRGNSFAGDYNGNAFFDGIIYPSWVDMRNAVTNIADNDVYAAVVNTRAPNPPDNFIVKINAENPRILDLFWEAPTERAFGQKLTPAEFSYILKRNDEKIAILPSTEKRFKDENLIPYQLYEYEIATFSGKDTSLFVSASAYAGGSNIPSKPEILAISGDEERKIRLEIKIPALRVDNETQIVRLKQLEIYRDLELVKIEELTQKDTGKKIVIVDNAAEDGYYKYQARISEDLSEFGHGIPKSEFSNLVYTYTGPIKEEFIENFEAPQMKKYYRTENWSITNQFYRSQPYSLTLSKDGNYGPSWRDTLLLFPIKSSIDGVTNLNFWHAAIVQQRDSAFVEISKDGGRNWEILDYFDKTKYEPWGDNELNQSDWKFESFAIASSNDDTIYCRFRFISDYFRHDKGWYIDDIHIYHFVSVSDDETPNLMIYPNPASNYLNLNFTNRVKTSLNIEVYDILGNSVSNVISKKFRDKSILLDITELAEGVYILLINDDSGIIYRDRFVKIK